MDKVILLNTKYGMIMGIFVSEDDIDIKIKNPYQVRSMEGMLSLNSVLILSTDNIVEIKKNQLLHSPTIPEDSLITYYNATREYDLISLKNSMDEALLEQSNFLFKQTQEAVLSEIIDILPDGVSKETLEQRKIFLYSESPSSLYH